MHSALESMLEKYKCRTIEDYKKALMEIIQEVTLLGLYRHGFFKTAAFYGGTALRVFHGLERFSEDLDFSLLNPNASFELSEYSLAVQNELGAYGLEMTVEEKIKKNRSVVKSAFIKGGTQIHLIKINSISPPVSGVHPYEQIKIKLEIDTDPPSGAEYDIRYQLNPVPYYVRLYAPSSLFAGKVHALLCRSWQNRIKGRDFFDFVWYLSKDIAVNINHLQARMIQTGHLSPDQPFNEKEMLNRLFDRFTQVDFEQVKKDILPFIKNPSVLDLWSVDFFKSITRNQLKISGRKSPTS